MMKNTKLYPKSRLKELQDLTATPCQKIKKDMACINMKSLVGCRFQRTKKQNTHKITPRRKAYLTLSERFFFLPNIGAIAIAQCQ